METQIKSTAELIADNKRELHQLEYKLYLESRMVKPQPAKTAKELRDERYKTKNGLTVHNLRQAGNIVKITHIRYAEMDKVPVLIPIPSYMRKLTDFWPRGGVTYVMITAPDKEVYSSVSICHEVDCFDYRLGVKKALEQFSQETAEALLAPLQATHEDVPVIADTVSVPAEDSVSVESSTTEALACVA